MKLTQAMAKARKGKLIRRKVKDSYELITPEGGWVARHPLTELQEMIPAEKIITVIHNHHDLSGGL